MDPRYHRGLALQPRSGAFVTPADALVTSALRGARRRRAMRPASTPRSCPCNAPSSPCPSPPPCWPPPRPRWPAGNAPRRKCSRPASSRCPATTGNRASRSRPIAASRCGAVGNGFAGEQLVVLMSRATRRGWSTPVLAPFSGTYDDVDTIFSPDGKTVYFSSRRPVNAGDPPRADFDLWRVRYDARQGFGTPVHLARPEHRCRRAVPEHRSRREPLLRQQPRQRVVGCVAQPSPVKRRVYRRRQVVERGQHRRLLGIQPGDLAERKDAARSRRSRVPAVTAGATSIAATSAMASSRPPATSAPA